MLGLPLIPIAAAFILILVVVAAAVAHGVVATRRNARAFERDLMSSPAPEIRPGSPSSPPPSPRSEGESAIEDHDSGARASLPPPVERYLRWALGTAAHDIHVVRLTQHGRLRADAHSKRWMSFTARHVATPVRDRLGFFWDAKVRLGPLTVRVHDAFTRGTGTTHARLFSVFPLGKGAHDARLDAGSLHRYLAEAVWYPTALLPGQGLSWSPLTDTSALASLSHRGVTVSLVFRFRPDGAVSSVFTPARWGQFDGVFREVAWEGHFHGLIEHAGVRVPRGGVVGWYDAKGHWSSVWEGTVDAYDAR